MKHKSYLTEGERNQLEILIRSLGSANKKIISLEIRVDDLQKKADSMDRRIRRIEKGLKIWQ